MKKYLKKLLVGLLVTAMSVTNINYVPVLADLTAGDELITNDLDPTMSTEANWTYNNAWFKNDDASAGFSTSGFAKNGDSGYWGAIGNEASVVSKNSFDLKAGTYTLKFKAIAKDTDVYPYVSGKVESSVANVSNKDDWGNPVEKELTFVVKEDTSDVSLGLVMVATSGDAWFNVSDLSIVYTSSEVPKDYWIAGKAEAFGEDWTEVKMTKEKDGTYSYELGELSLSSLEATVYYNETWGKVKWFESVPIAAEGFVKLYATIDEENYDNSTLIAKVYTDGTYKTEVELEEKDYYVGTSGDITDANKMTKDSDGKYIYKFGQVTKDTTTGFGIYSSTSWDDKVVEWKSYSNFSDGYAEAVFNSVSKKVEYKIFEDDEYTKEIVVKTYYVGFSNNLSADNVMTEDADGKYIYKCGQVYKTDGKVGYSIYTSPSDWSSNVVDWTTSQIYADGYAEIVYDSEAGTVEYKIFEDSEYTNYIEDTSVKPDFYFGYKLTGWSDGVCEAMTKDAEGKYSYECGKLSAGELGYEVDTKPWKDSVITWTSYDIPAEGYLKAFYDSAANVVSFKLYTDDTYTTEVKVENPKKTLYVYYPGDKEVANDTLTIAFAKSAVASSADADKLGDPYAETYWNRVCYPLKKVKDNWYSFDVYKDFGGFQIVANPHSEVYPTNNYDNENTTWIIDFGYYGDVKTDDVDNVRYNAMFNSENDAVYVMYNTLFDSIEEAESFDKAFGWDYYIAGSTGDFEPKCDPGIFSNYWAQDNYHYVEAEDRYTGDINWQDQMTKSKDGKSLTWVSPTKTTKFETYALNVYADKSWFGKVWKNNFSFLAVADAYVKVTYDLENSKFSVEYFDDTECTEPTEFDEITIYYYYGVTGAKDIYVAFNAEIPGQKIAKTYWGRNCYAMTEVGKGWYVFKGYKAIYGGYQIVVNPQNEDFDKGDKEDKEGTLWLTDIGDYGDVSTSDADLSRFKAFLLAGNKAYIKYNKVFKTQNEADSFTDWTYYVAGSTSAYTNTDAGKGIFSNYWAGDFEKGVDDEGKEYEKKVDTWPDVLTKEKDNVYSIKLGKAVKGTTYAFNVYTEKDWNATNLTGSMGAANPSFKATSNNYVKLYFNRDLKDGKNTWSIEYYTDKECKTKAKMSAPKKLKLKKLKATKGGKIKLSWKAVEGATSYGIYANGKKIGFSKKNSKVIKYKNAGKTVKYTVVARSPQYGNSEQSKALKVTTPGKVKKIKVKGQKKGIKVTWKKAKKAKKAKGYVVYRSTKKKKGFKKVASVKKAKFLDKKASKGKKYFYKVYAFKKNGKIKVYSNASKAKSAKRK